MEDVEQLKLEPPPTREARVVTETPAPEWHSQSWRPAGSASLADRWLRAGESRSGPVPPLLRRRR